MNFRAHKTINYYLAFLLMCYSLLATSHFGHTHIYGQAEPGYCITQCENAHHFDTKPVCKGFPLNLTLGLLQSDHASEPIIPIFPPENLCNEDRGTRPSYAFKDQSRAPPLG